MNENEKISDFFQLPFSIKLIRPKTRRKRYKNEYPKKKSIQKLCIKFIKAKNKKCAGTRITNKKLHDK